MYNKYNKNVCKTLCFNKSMLCFSSYLLDIVVILRVRVALVLSWRHSTTETLWDTEQPH